jgi:excinuclease ABC subunit A
LHPLDVEKLVTQLDGLVEAGNTVVVVEHEMRIVARSDWVIDIGPGAGEDGGRVVASGTPANVASARGSRTAPYLARFFGIEPSASRAGATVPRRDAISTVSAHQSNHPET